MLPRKSKLNDHGAEARLVGYSENGCCLYDLNSKTNNKISRDVVFDKTKLRVQMHIKSRLMLIISYQIMNKMKIKGKSIMNYDQGEEHNDQLSRRRA